MVPLPPAVSPVSIIEMLSMRTVVEFIATVESDMAEISPRKETGGAIVIRTSDEVTY